jgi:hypothetical protein
MTRAEQSVVRLVELTDAAACADMLRAAPAEWQCRAERTRAGWQLLAPRFDILVFNRILATGLDAEVTPDALAAVIEPFAAARLRNFGVQLSPAAQSPDLERMLSDVGLFPRDNWAKVYRDASLPGVIDTRLRIDEVTSRDAAVCARVAREGFGMPPDFEPWLANLVGRPGWTHYLARDGDDPVATAALYVHDRAGWLGIAATLPSARRRGGQSALMARRLRDGIASGCTRFVTETGEDLPEKPNPSFRNMMRAGFKLAYQRRNYMPPKPLS